GGALQAARQALDAEGEARLSHHLPQHRLAPRRKALLQPVAPGHEVVDLCARPKSAPNRQGGRDHPRPLAPVGIVEAALIGVYAVTEPEIVKVPDDPIAGADSEELDPARGEIAPDQQNMKRLEKPRCERMRLAAAGP